MNPGMWTRQLEVGEVVVEELTRDLGVEQQQELKVA